MKRAWRKTLYENIGYADNYTDVSFLQELRTNIHVRNYTLEEAIAGAARLNSHFTLIAGFLTIFCTMYTEVIPPTFILLPSVLSSIIGYLIFFKHEKFHTQQLLEHSKTLITVLVFGYLFAPLLHTLTGASSTDTIFYVTFFVMVINFISHDYGLSVAVLSPAISMTAAIFGAICLASRLSTSYHAFVLLVDSVVFFVIYPMLTTLLYQLTYSLLLSALTASALFQFSTIASCSYLFMVIFLHFICPLIFVKVQRYKQNIHGPWDEAMVATTFETPEH